VPTQEPLAIVGVGCRLPGEVASLSDLEALLREGRSGIVPVPADRWDAEGLYHPDFRKRAHLQATRGGFLSDASSFDAGFFGIAPKEALRMDPQQRLILETSYEAVEDAGIPLGELAGTRTSVFVGAGSHDYGTIQTEHVQIGPTSNTGVAGSIISNRVSFLFDLRGPSATVDTACSSALVALHMACRSIWDGSADLAFAGGVNLILRPESSLGFSKGGYLSPDCECRAFSDHANGYVRSEGAAMALLLPQSEADRRGLRIHGLVLATVLNSDGRTPGMTMPSRPAQEAMLQEAYAQAGVTPDEVHYVEAHGTGTAIGDPIEAGAIGTVLGAPRQGGAPLYLGSIKTNVGHLETGAGMAGLLKLVLVLSRRTLYPNLNFRAPNPEIPFDALKLEVPTDLRALPESGRLVGGVNSFGFGGTNGHLVLASPPEPAAVESSGPLSGPLPGAPGLWVSARSEPALRASAGALAGWLAEDATPLAQVSAALVRQRGAFPFRLVQCGRSREELVAGLRAFAGDDSPPEGVLAGQRARVPDGAAPQPVVFVFSGQGPQWFAMGRELMEREPLYRATVLEVEAELQGLGWLPESSLTTELGRDEASSRIGETEIAQPALFALQLGLAALLRAHGVEPAAVVGHSIGELAAAVTAGALTLREGARIVVCRSRAQALAEGKGAMAALGLSEAAVAPFLAAFDLDLAAVNGPQGVTVAGEHEAVAALGAHLESPTDTSLPPVAGGTFFRRLEVSVPFHCRLMDPAEALFREALGEVELAPTRLPFVSTVTGEVLPGEALDTDYWWNNIRQAVRFFPAVETLIGLDHALFLEIAPHPVLRRGIRGAFEAAGLRGKAIPTLIRGEPEPLALASAVGALFLANVPCRPVSRELPVQVLELPRYPFQRKRYWLETPQASFERRRGLAHPTVGWPIHSSVSQRRFSTRLSVDPVAEGYLLDHHVQGLIVLPGAGQLEACHSAGVVAWGTSEHHLEDVVLRLPISLPPEGDPPEFWFEVYSDEGHFQISSRRAASDATREGWTVHTRGRLNAIDPFPARELDLDEIRARVSTPFDPARFYAGMAETGLELGECFQGIQELYLSESTGEVLTKVVAPDKLEHELLRYAFHPALLDAVFQGSSLGSFRQALHGLFLPHRVRAMKFHRQADGSPLWCYAHLTRIGEGEVELDVFAVDTEGRTVVELHGFVLKLVAGSAQARESLSERPFYELAWEEAELPREQLELRGKRFLVLDTDTILGASLCAGLAAAGAEVERVGHGHKLSEVAPRHWTAPSQAAARFLQEQPAGRSWDGLIHLWSLAEGAQGPSAALERGPAALCEWVGAISSAGAWRFDAARPVVWAISAGAWPEAASQTLQPWGAALWGAARVLRNEDPRLQTTSVDVSSSDPDEVEARALLTWIMSPKPPTELRLRGERSELQRLRSVEQEPAKTLPVGARPYRAAMRTVGVLDSAALVEARRRAPAPHEAEVETRAAAINFKDVVVGMGLIDRGAWEGGASRAELGMDLAGVVTRVGSEVTDLKPGDEVLGLASGSLASHVTVKALHLIPRPKDLGVELAASLPTVFLTAELALRRLARLQPGETVLIHAGAGGVGTAAVQIANEIGARVLATTSSQRKRDYLAEFGVTEVFDSRSPRFRDQVMEATEGRGVDVLLNSLGGESITQGIRCLAHFGRFVEIGKLDLVQNRQIGLEPFLRNLSYHCLDTNRWVSAFTPEANRLMRELAAKVAAGVYRMPLTPFPITETDKALRALAQGKQVGKVSITLPREGEIEVYPGERELFRPDGTYLVTGGCAGFGLELADWISREGGGALVLLNRSGVKDEARERIAAIEARGTRVLAPPTDVGHPDALAAVLVQAREELAPLRGVFHAAMVLDDGPLAELSAERFARVGHPKVSGGWNLHLQTASDPLDHFFLFSSIAAVLGTPGQANYAAANAFLDGLAHARRAAGLPGTAIDLGIVDGAGVVARASEETRGRILGKGIEAFDVARTLELLAEVLRVEPTERVAAAIDWQALTLPPEDRETCFSALTSGEARGGEGLSLLDALLETPAAERADRIVAWVGEFLAQISGQEASEIDAGASLSRLGIDSLMANQLLLWLQTSFQVEVPLVRLMQGPTVRELAEEVAQRALLSVAPLKEG
jgi:acyl transferase domain-containing protein/NADPH:quinone reductase-like Zn-dependent oxidoreductase/NAD(P)-dependent dehydrogenase (short-subunit alcohol dehydrogenase family)/acyl carrier protein